MACVTTYRFAEPATNAISYHGIAVFLGNGEPGTWFIANLGNCRFFLFPFTDFQKK